MNGEIRKHSPSDLPLLMDIWVKANKLAHPFLSQDFVDLVDEAMRTRFIPHSDTWVYVENDKLLGFVSMADNEIGGLFVQPDHHRKGIGKYLVQKVDQMHDVLEVEVFEKNQLARPFYEKLGFIFMKKYLHEPSGEVVERLQKRAL